MFHYNHNHSYIPHYTAAIFSIPLCVHSNHLFSHSHMVSSIPIRKKIFSNSSLWPINGILPITASPGQSVWYTNLAGDNKLSRFNAVARKHQQSGSQEREYKGEWRRI